MPIPQPQDGEDRNDFLRRCMGDETMRKEYPRKPGDKYPSQRYAICMTQWRDHLREKERK